MGIRKRARKVKVRQRDRTTFGGNFVGHTSFKIMDSFLVLGKFAIDAEVLDIGNRDVILRLSWLTEYGFLVDTQDRSLRNVKSGQVIPRSVRFIPEVLMMEEEQLEDGEILLIIDVRE